MTRPDTDDYYLNIALAVSLRGTCVRRQVGCVLVDTRVRVLSTGYNGPASGLPHCVEHPCEGADFPSGTGLDSCEAIHAEANALLTCPDVFRIMTCYCTVSPCVHCVKLLLGTGCRRVVFAEEYPQKIAKERWLAAGREWVHRPIKLLNAIHYGPGLSTAIANVGDHHVTWDKPGDLSKW